MAESTSRRLNDLEKAINPSEETLIIVDWGGSTLIINGEEISRSDYEARYPDRLTVEWQEDPQNTIVKVGFDLGAI